MLTQPIHTVYGGAHLFRRDTRDKLGRIAWRTFVEHQALLPVSEEIRARVRQKLLTKPVEDLRIDFEDGYGFRAQEEEDGHAVNAAKEVATGLKEGTLPALLGIRTKPLEPHSRERALRTLRLFFDTLHGDVPPHFVVALPKVRTPEQLSELCAAVPDVAVEIMCETPQALGNLNAICEAGQGRCRAVHFGPYDFTASCGVLASGLRHPLCDHARNAMLVSLAGTGLWLSDGPTGTLPTGDAGQVRQAWETQWLDVRHSLATGFYQGWDLHPAQIPLRCAAVFSFFTEQAPAAGARLRNFIGASAQATRVGAAFDDAATALGLRLLFLRGLHCGAFTEEDVKAHTGLAPVELETLRF